MWLDPEMIKDEPNIHVLDPSVSQRYLETDPSLELDFFDYSDEVREAIAACVRFKARHNARTVAAMTAVGGVAPTPAKLQQEAAASVG